MTWYSTNLENSDAIRVLGYDSESRMTINSQFTHPFDEMNLLNWNDLDSSKSHRYKCYNQNLKLLIRRIVHNLCHLWYISLQCYFVVLISLWLGMKTPYYWWNLENCDWIVVDNIVHVFRVDSRWVVNEKIIAGIKWSRSGVRVYVTKGSSASPHSYTNILQYWQQRHFTKNKI